ncbi:MAG: glutamate--cysteine ligase [Caulobacteraceae bacterium]|nr:glutamate--cysteine ligase [Caulobacteraceae bacterium]
MSGLALDDAPLTLEVLAGELAKGCKPRSAMRIGAEHEKFGFHRADHTTIQYGGERGIHALMAGLTRFGWTGLYEGDRLIALGRDSASVSLEPGGQFELSGAPLADLHAIAAETADHLAEVSQVSGELGLGFLNLGFHPTLRREDAAVMPKGRYDIMRRYMPKVGKLGLDMMFRTCTVQVNLDFESEADMIAKFRTSLALQPLATALFANSPFVEGRPSGLLSSRANVWTDTDPDRTGLLDFVFEAGFGFDRYADYALDVPMYFVKRDGRYIDAAGLSFRDFIAGRLSVAPGVKADLKDWESHLTTAFPEVRLKTFLEMRGADSGPEAMLNALPAFWVGLLYDPSALAAAGEIVRDWTMQDLHGLRRDVPRLALKAQLGGRSLGAVAKEVMAIARSGLKARGLGEEVYLDPLDEITDSGLTQADRLLEKFHGPWGGDIDRAFTECVF